MKIFREIKGIPEPEENKENSSDSLLPEHKSIFEDEDDPKNVVTDSIFDE